MWSEEPHHAAWTSDGRLVSKIRSFKTARIVGKPLFLYTRFFHAHKDVLACTRPLADVAVLRSVASFDFNPAQVMPSAILFEQVLIQSRVPFEIIFDHHLEDLSKCKVLVLANQDALSDHPAAKACAGGSLRQRTCSSHSRDRLRRTSAPSTASVQLRERKLEAAQELRRNARRGGKSSGR